jgi:hypothetical protein
MPDVFFRCQQALEAAFRFLIITVHIDQNLRGTPIVCNMNRSHANQPDARIGKLAFHQGFDLFAQSFPQPAAMIFDRTLLHRTPRSKTNENIRKQAARVGIEVLLSRTKQREG